jgi:hypothetical protein
MSASGAMRTGCFGSKIGLIDGRFAVDPMSVYQFD